MTRAWSGLSSTPCTQWCSSAGGHDHNNVINPTAGQVVNLHYVMQKSGNVTITVFDLSGSIITVLGTGKTRQRGPTPRRGTGEQERGAVARGIYFVRVVGPDFDEIRKVLVVR